MQTEFRRVLKSDYYKNKQKRGEENRGLAPGDRFGGISGTTSP
jgi:hypothetical protein